MRLRNGLLAVLIAAAFPASAAAAPDKTAELSADTPTFAWTGEGSGLPLHASGDVNFLLGLAGQEPSCDTAAHDCDYILLDVKHPGSLKITLTPDGAETHEVPAWGNVTVPDIDVYFYASDKDGTPQGESLTEAKCATGEGVETCEAEGLKAGFYVVEVSFFLADGATYKADVALTTSVPPTSAAPVAPETPAAPPAPPAEQPAPAAQPQQPAAPAPPHSADEPKPTAKKKASKRAACQKKAKKIKNKGKRKKALKRCAKIKR